MQMNNEKLQEIGCWKKEKELGAGAFGYVVLWRNKETNERIALKQCRWGNDPLMNTKQRDRWKLEVDMMLRLNHPNVVKAIRVPHELDVPFTELPLLAMEYCSNGDLRKLLNRPENCCGLKEKHVRLLLKHVSSAINYLHSKRIIHRDLKPENIVIQDLEGKVIYKLIDLGYAKELDHGSLCTSFVGTLQYLAPELFMSQKYSCTVDYWSLGLVTHEIITGLRPFLPDLKPPEWIPIIEKKSSSDIRAYLDEDKNIVFSKEISPLNHICSILRSDIELWLQLMLEWDPKKRGKNENTTAFALLERILNKKVAFVFCVDIFKFINIEITEDQSLEEFQKQLEKETNIPLNHQEILFQKGHGPNPEKGAMQFLSNLEEDSSFVFLYNNNNQSSMPSLSNTFIPHKIEKIMRNPRVEMHYHEQRIAWAQSVYLSHQEHLLFYRLIQAFKANLMNLLTKTSYAHKIATHMISEMNKLSAKYNFFRKSYEQDLNAYEQQAHLRSFTSKQMIDGWKNNYENLKCIDILQKKVSTLEGAASNISTKTIELQRSPYARSKQNNPLEDIYHKILDAYSELRRRNEEQRHIPHDNTDMVRLLCLCFQHRRNQIQDVTIHIKKITEIKNEIDDFLPHMDALISEIRKWDKQVDIQQTKRQCELWTMINILSNKIHQMEQISSSVFRPISPHMSKNSIDFSRNIFAQNTNYEPVVGQQGLNHPFILPSSFAPVITPLLHSTEKNIFGQSSPNSFLNENGNSESMLNSNSMNPTCLSSLVEQTTEESQRIKKKNEEVIESFQKMLETLKICQDNKLVSDACNQDKSETTLKKVSK